MAGKVRRLLDPAVLPTSLFDPGSDLLILPPELVRCYRKIVEIRGLLSEASAYRASSPVGGVTQEATDEHLCHAFDGSAARTLLAILDPHRRLGSVSDAFVESLSGEDVCLVDAPCGSAAASLTFLTTIAELRRAGVLPRQPLNVVILGAELSEPARDYASQLLEDVRPCLRAEAIFVQRIVLTHWDVLDPGLNADLIGLLHEYGRPPIRRLCVVANFSAFLTTSGKLRSAMEQINALFLHASRGEALALWLEPPSNKATESGGVFSHLVRRFVKWIKREHDEQGLEIDPLHQAEQQFQPAIRPGPAKTRLAVMRFDLTRE